MNVHLPIEHVRAHREHIRRGLIHMSLFLFIFDMAGTSWLVYLHVMNLEFYGNCGKSGAILATLSCYLEGA